MKWLVALVKLQPVPKERALFWPRSRDIVSQLKCKNKNRSCRRRKRVIVEGWCQVSIWAHLCPPVTGLAPCSTVYYSQQTRTSPPDTLHAPCARVEDSKVRRADAGCAQDHCSTENIFGFLLLQKKKLNVMRYLPFPRTIIFVLALDFAPPLFAAQFTQN